MPRHEVIAGLDIGTTKVTVVTGEIREGGNISITGVGHSSSAGLRRGVVVDIDGTVRAIDEAVEKARRMSGSEIKSVYLGLTGSHVASATNRGVVAVSREDREISAEDVHRVMEAARVISIPADREIIHLLPREFIVDGYDGIKDPVGMVGVRLEVETQIITCVTTSLQNLLRSVYKAGLEVDEVVLASLASGEAVLTPAEKELGVAVADIGGGTTDLAIFERGSLLYASVLPIGGEHISNDLAVGLRTPVAQAEKVKVEHGWARVEDTEDQIFLEIPKMSGSGGRQISEKVVASIIEARAQEMLQLIGREIKRSGHSGAVTGGLVLTGGTARLRSLVELAASELDMPARVGLPAGLGALTDVVGGPDHSTAVGLLIYATRGRAGSPGSRTRERVLGGWLARLKGFFREMF
ncbi:MAG: cell division protein FtsA [Firmicutes bacterium]|nr:cell division protein FtsA [Bacillota bacterium]MCL5040574.1 cell division protein FtsA [Bacillota bacterium]